jgi:hypothetical protein
MSAARMGSGPTPTPRPSRGGEHPRRGQCHLAPAGGREQAPAEPDLQAGDLTADGAVREPQPGGRRACDA